MIHWLDTYRTIGAPYNWETISQWLASAGITGELNRWATAQAIFEMGYFNHKLPPYNNYSNIRISKHSPYQDGVAFDTWAKYKTPEDWAKDMRRVISLKNLKTEDNPGGPPAIQAATLPEYVRRLKANGYFGSGSEAAYLKGLQALVKSHGGDPGLAGSFAPSMPDLFANIPLVTGLGIAAAALLLASVLRR